MRHLQAVGAAIFCLATRILPAATSNTSCSFQPAAPRTTGNVLIQQVTKRHTLVTAPLFELVDGNTDQACRGATVEDNNPSYYSVFQTSSLEGCQTRCLDTPRCQGIEFSPGRCEVWTRTAGIQSTKPLNGFACFRYTNASSLSTDFELVDGGMDRACRGASVDDNSPTYYKVLSESLLEGCQAKCRAQPGCQGIEFSKGRCEIWMRAEGIQSTKPLQGYECMRYNQASNGIPTSSDFEPVDGDIDRACRGADPSDNSPTYYEVFPEATLEGCRARCSMWKSEHHLNHNGPLCQGIEFVPGRCEIWTRTAGIQSTANVKGYECLSYKLALTTSSTSTIAPTTRPPATTGSCARFTAWPDVDNGVTCDGCTALVLTTPYGGRCDRYCESFGHRCVSAAEEESESCTVKYSQACDREILSTSDMLCTCEMLDSPVTTVRITTSETPPATSCHTALPGEKCHGEVTWAMTDGIFSNPQWYPGLSPSSSFEDFQKHLHDIKAADGACPLPCEPPTTGLPTSSPLPSTACDAVLQSIAADDWSSDTCSGRINWYQTQAGGALNEQEAKAQAALFYSACEPCWPWPKYKQPGSTRVSSKRGIAISNDLLSSAALASLSEGISWGYIWHFNPDTVWGGGPGLSEWESFGIRFVPMIWGEKQLSPAENGGLPAGRMALLGFNEPNFWDQANLSPAQAAAMWPRVEQLAKDAGINYLVSPAVNFAAYDPIDWLRDFFAACDGCKIDAIAFHSYTCYGRWLKDHIQKYKVFKKPLWLTEFACSESGSLERRDAAGQASFMREVVPMLEHDADIEMYAWFSYFEDEWGHALENGKNGDAGLVNRDGTLSELGRLYASFETTAPVRSTTGIRTTSTTTTMTLRSTTGARTTSTTTTASQAATSTPPVASCHTALPGETCYKHVEWAMSEGIFSNPQWYPGLSSSSSFEEFQNLLHKTKANDGACPLPCRATSSRPMTAPASTTTFQVISDSTSVVGVNVFGADGFKDDNAARIAVRSLLNNGVRHFRVVNVGAWQDAMLKAIDDEAASLGSASKDVSVQITSLFFNSPASCSSLPSWMDFSLSTTRAKLRALQHIGRILIQLDTCSICQGSELYCINPTEQAMQGRHAFVNDDGPDGYGRAHLRAAHEALPLGIEFVIPYMSEKASPDTLVQSLVSRHVAPLQALGRKFHVEGTFYPFWTSAEQSFAPFPANYIQGFTQKAQQLGFDGFVVAETGWPRACPKAPAESTRPATLQNMCKYFASVLTDANSLASRSLAESGTDLLVYHWKLGPADDGSCGSADTWGLFRNDGSFVCADAMPGWT